MKFAPFSRSFRLHAGFDFEADFPVLLASGALATSGDLTGYTLQAQVKRSPDHADDHSESFVPAVSFASGTATVKAPAADTAGLRAGQMILALWATKDSEKLLVGRASLFVETEAD